MAWHEFDQDGLRGITGDDPLDEFALAMTRIRHTSVAPLTKPTMAELTYSLKAIVAANPGKYISDTGAVGTAVVPSPRGPPPHPSTPLVTRGCSPRRPSPVTISCSEDAGGPQDLRACDQGAHPECPRADARLRVRDPGGRTLRYRRPDARSSTASSRSTTKTTSATRSTTSSSTTSRLVTAGTPNTRSEP